MTDTTVIRTEMWDWLERPAALVRAVYGSTAGVIEVTDPWHNGSDLTKFRHDVQRTGRRIGKPVSIRTVVDTTHPTIAIHKAI